MRLIDANVLENSLLNWMYEDFEIDGPEYNLLDKVYESLKGMPSFYPTVAGDWRYGQPTKKGDVEYSDFVKVIRCKDCKWSERTDLFLLCGAWDARAVDDNDFCSSGERRSE